MYLGNKLKENHVLMDDKKYKYLETINSPSKLKELRSEELPTLAKEIREYLVELVSENGGHLSSNLGAVEMTIAIHRVFNSPDDHIIFDVGHQSYTHKILTERFREMSTLRKPGGISGFTKMSESEHDCFGAGHSSTSLSAGLGFAESDKLAGRDNYTVVVFGDGAYTGGMIHEALNNCKKDLKLIIILNENEISISKTTGKFADNLAKIRARSSYFKAKKTTRSIIKKIPLVGKPLFRVLLAIKKGVKNMLYGSNYFESMGLTYLGPVDGNDVESTETLLREAKKLGESVLVHIKTKKGKGYPPAENDPSFYHGLPPRSSGHSSIPSFSATAAQAITDMAESDGRICAITAAMSDGTGLGKFKEKHAERFFDVGIAEEHALTFASGLAANGMRPFPVIYSTFLQRSYDNIIHDMALQSLPVTICVDRCGLNVGDGATHHGIFDVSFLSGIPNIEIYTPVTNERLRACLREALERGVPCAVRYPKGCESEDVVKRFYGGKEKSIGAVCDFTPEDSPSAVIITDGAIVREAITAAEIHKIKNIKVGIILLEKIKPFDKCAELIEALFPKNTPVIFLEEEIRSGGMGMNISDAMRRRGTLPQSYEIMAIDDSFVHQKSESIYRDAGISYEDIINTVRKLLIK